MKTLMLAFLALIFCQAGNGFAQDYPKVFEDSEEVIELFLTMADDIKDTDRRHSKLKMLETLFTIFLDETEQQDAKALEKMSEVLARSIHLYVSDSSEEKLDSKKNAEYLYREMNIRVPLHKLNNKAAADFYFDELGGHKITDQEYIAALSYAAKGRHYDYRVETSYLIELMEKRSDKSYADYLLANHGWLRSQVYRSNNTRDRSAMRFALDAGVIPSFEDVIYAYSNFGYLPEIPKSRIASRLPGEGELPIERTAKRRIEGRKLFRDMQQLYLKSERERSWCGYLFAKTVRLPIAKAFTPTD